jgi:sarcosine oxidase
MARARLVTVQDADHVIVGAGLLGLATARALQQRGRHVIVLEQGRPGHAGSGSKGSARVFRLGYADPRYVRLARQARPLWAELEADAGKRLLHPVPQLTFGRQLAAMREAMTAAGAAFEVLTARESAERFPAVLAGQTVLLERESAVIAADQVLAALAAGAGDLRPGTEVTGLADDGRQVTVRTAAGRLTAPCVIVCAGPASSGLLGAAGIRVPAAPVLTQVAYLNPAGCHQRDTPIFIRFDDQAPYGLPVPGSAQYKIGLHPSGPPAGPGWEHQLQDDPELSLRLDGLARRFLPGFDPVPAATERCVYDNSPDGDFIVDRAGNIVIGCGTSGHGFKFGPLFGRWLADLATGSAPEPPPQFRLSRFSS